MLCFLRNGREFVLSSGNYSGVAEYSQRGQDAPRPLSWFIIIRRMLPPPQIVLFLTRCHQEDKVCPGDSAEMIFLLGFIYILRLGLAGRGCMQSSAAVVGDGASIGSQRLGLLCAQSRNRKIPRWTVLKSAQGQGTSGMVSTCCARL